MSEAGEDLARRERIKRIEARLESIERDLKKLTELTTLARGGLLVLIGLGTFAITVAGLLASTWHLFADKRPPI